MSDITPEKAQAMLDEFGKISVELGPKTKLIIEELEAYARAYIEAAAKRDHWHKGWTTAMGEFDAKCKQVNAQAAEITRLQAKVDAADMEKITQQAARDARDVFSGFRDAREAVDYMEQLIYAALSAFQEAGK